MRYWLLGCLCFILPGITMPAAAQSGSPLLQGDIPFEYSRGRNESVTERPRPEYRAQGILVGGFTLFPGVDIAPGYSNNVYSRPAKTDDAFVDVSPQVEASSNWQRHRLNLAVGGRLRRFADETLMNENGWYARVAGRLEVGTDTKIDVIARSEKLYETRYSPAATTNVQSSVPYRVDAGRVLVQTMRGRFRLAALGNLEDYDFKPVRLAGGGSIVQDNRDRSIVGGAALVEYAISPDTSIFAQVDYEDTDYRLALAPGVANRDSNTARVLAGVSLDVSTLIRGRLGIGYTNRDYRSPIYRDLNGFAVEAKLEYFPSPITTVSLTARRKADDASIGVVSGYISNYGNLRVDHELLRNLLLNGQVAYERGSYEDIGATSKIFRATLGARYLVSRNLTFRLEAAYGERSNKGSALIGPSFSETRGQLTVALRL